MVNPDFRDFSLLGCGGRFWATGLPFTDLMVARCEPV